MAFLFRKIGALLAAPFGLAKLPDLCTFAGLSLLAATRATPRPLIFCFWFEMQALNWPLKKMQILIETNYQACWCKRDDAHTPC